jgi:thiol-disulfide isomerase/thioredoxin
MFSATIALRKPVRRKVTTFFQTAMKIFVLLFSLVSLVAISLAEEAVAENDGLYDSTTRDSANQIEGSAANVSRVEANSEHVPTTATPGGESAPTQTGPLANLLGSTLLSLEMLDESHAQIVQNYTTDALRGKKVIGLYFSADWCGPCRQFTPELASFYKEMNSRRGKQDEFEIVWVSRCRDVDSYGQYFTQMPWIAMPPEEAMGERGQMLSNKYKVKGIPSLVLLDDLGNVITTDARNKIPQDKAGIGFPWRNPLVSLYMTVLPRSLRMMMKSQLTSVKDMLLTKAKSVVGLKRASVA